MRARRRFYCESFRGSTCDGHDFSPAIGVLGCLAAGAWSSITSSKLIRDLSHCNCNGPRNLDQRLSYTDGSEEGTGLDNVFVERLWRAVKYEDIYIQGYEEVPELRRGLARYFAFYNHARLHQALGYRTPAAVYATPLPRDLQAITGERAGDNLDASRRGAAPGPGDLSPGTVARTRFGGQGRVARRRACR